jgi:O-antigen/teichoic acid export membrane protein
MLLLVASLQQLGDSKGLTIRPQLIGAAVSAGTVIVIIALALSGWLDLYTYIWVNLAAAGVTASVLAYYLLRGHRELCWQGSIRGKAKAYAARWWRFASPLIALEYYLVGLSFLGIYLIQLWYGATEQAYYALALRWSAVALVFISAAIMIVWREMAAAFAAGDVQRTARIYRRFSQSLFFLSVALGCWLVIVAESLVLLVAGDDYRAAAPVMMIMAFYPAAQTVGSLNAAAYKGIGRTREYRNLSIALSVPDLLLTYFLLASVHAAIPGFGLGAVGMALKTAVWGLLSVHILEWRTCRYLGIDFRVDSEKKVVNAICLGICGGFAYFGAALGSQGPVASPMAFFFLASLQYWVTVGALVLVRPTIAGVTREELQTLVKRGLALVGLRGR